MTKKFIAFILKNLQCALDLKYGSVTFYVADGKVVDVEFNHKVSRAEINDSQN